MRNCERPWKRSASEALPSSVSNRYSLSIRTHGSSCRRRASSSLRRVSSFSASSSSSRALSHCSRVPVSWVVIICLLWLVAPLRSAGLAQYDLARFEQRLEVGKNPRPATGHGLDQLRGIALDRVADGQLHGVVLRFELDGAARITFARQLRPELVPPLQDDP